MCVTVIEYRRTLTTKMVNSLKGQKKTREYEHFWEGAVIDIHYSTIDNSLIFSLEQPEAESGVSKHFTSEVHKPTMYFP